MASLISLSSSSSSSSSFFSPMKSLKRLASLKSTTKIILRCRRTLTVSSVRSPETEPPPAVQAFWKWLSDEKVVSAKTPAKPGVVQEGLGLIAQRDIGRNEVVLEVPKRFWINPDTVAASEIGKVCGGLKPWVSVALFLIREKQRKDSPWRLYLDILPDCTDSTIYWWVSLEYIIDIINRFDGYAQTE